MPSLTITALAVLTLLTGAGQDAAPQPAKPQTGRISGRVTDAVSGQPISEAQIFLNALPRPGEVGVRTDADGRYILEGVPAGRLIPRAEHPSYATERYMAIQSDGRQDMLAISAGQHVTQINFSLLRAGFVSGQITGEDGRPVVKAQVHAEAIGSRIASSFTSVFTNEMGEYELRLAAGRYLIDCSAPFPTGRQSQRFTLDRTYYPGVTRREDAVAVDVSVGDKLRNFNFPLVLKTLKTVVGRVISGGTSADGIRLSLVSSPGGKLSRIRAQQDNSFTFDGLTPGRYIIWAYAGSPGEMEVAFATLDLADDVVDLMLALGAAGRIAGRVTTDDKTPVPDGIRVIAALMDGAHDVDPTAPDQVEIDADGSFTIDGLFGTRRLRVTSLPPGWSLKTILINGREASPADVTVNAGAVTEKVRIVITRQ